MHNDKFGMVTYGEGMFLGGKPRHCVYTNALRGLSVIAKLLVFIVVSQPRRHSCSISLVIVIGIRFVM